MLQNLLWKTLLIVAVLALCVYSLYPPSQKIRLGKDLRGGTSLIYAVNIPANTPDKVGVLTQTISVLKDRVNPQGVLDISMQPLGIDRIEIVMPLPNEEVKALRKAYDDALSALKSSAQISEAHLDEALRINRAPIEFGGDDPQRAGKIKDLQDAYNQLQELRQKLKEARGAATQPAATQPASPPAATEPATQPATAATQPQAAVYALEQRVADTLDRYENLRAEILSQNLDQTRIIQALALPNERKEKLDPQGKPVLDAAGKAELEPSPREAALEALKSTFPQLAHKIDDVVAAHDAYQKKRTTLDDPEDLMRLLRGAGVLEFHIVVRSSNPEGVNVEDLRSQLAASGPETSDAGAAAWYPINSLKEWGEEPAQQAALEKDPQAYFGQRYDMVAGRYNGQVYVLLYSKPPKAMLHTADAHWTVESTGRTQDQLGRPAVSFRLDSGGGALMARLTGAHVHQKMAIVLDGQVYTAPNLNSQIGNAGIIEGDFSQDEIDYLTRVLAAGALGARLSDQPMAINTLGPSIGAENLSKGLQACLWSVIAVASFMLIYYFGAGLVAIVAVGVNAIMIFGVMAMIDGTFTLPGLAGMALTLCTAVDANILIYERIREELEAGEDLRGAIRLGYRRAMSTILDANVTNLIVCVALIKTATTEVKGFAMTLMIGILGTLFAALFITRVIYTFATDVFGMKRMPMLATTVPAVHRLLSPNLDWIGLRKFFIPLSATLVLISLVLIVMRGSALFDTEFRGGLSASMHTAIDPETKNPKLIKQIDFAERIHAIGHKADTMPPSDTREVMRELRDAEVLTLGETKVLDGHLAASGFQVKVSLPPGVKETTFKNAIVDAIISEVGSDLAVARPLTFAGAGSEDFSKYTFPITSSTLGDVIGRPQYRQSISGFIDGVAVVLDDINPPATREDIKERVTRLSKQPDFSDTEGRPMEVLGLEPVDPAQPEGAFKSVVMLVSDPKLSYSRVSFDQWEKRLAKREWQLVSQALPEPARLDQVSEFSSAVAHTLRANAIVATALSLLGILVYIWIRFGSLRYSAGAVIALIHDAVIGVGAVALSQLIGETAFAKALLIQNFHIDLSVVAAVLTLMGYSLNDTIVVLDRIRENRGKLNFPTAETVNKSINQTFSRTTLTSLTIFISLVIMYVLGGTGIRAFTFVMLVGMFVGTYSSIAIAAPMVFKGHDETVPGKRTVPQPPSPSSPPQPPQPKRLPEPA